MKFLIRFLCSAALLFLGMIPSLAQQQPPPQDKAAEKPKEEKKPPTPEEKIVQTKHSLKIGGQEIKYTATAGTRRRGARWYRRPWPPSRRLFPPWDASR